MFSAAFLVQALLVSAAFAIPSSKERFAARRARRSTSVSHQSTAAKFISSAADTDSPVAGVVLVSNTRFYENPIGTFTVPSALSSSVAGQEQCASVWIGMDGFTCSDVLLQVGVDMCVEDDAVGFAAWYEFYPGAASGDSGDFNITINPGDAIDLSVNVGVNNPFSGDVFVFNHNSGTFGVGKTLSSTSALCQTNVEWMVEDFSDVPLADFGTIQWTESQVLTNPNIITVGAGNPVILDIVQGGVQLTETSVSGSDITVRYIG